MKDWKLSHKIILINVGIVIFIGVLSGISSAPQGSGEFPLMFGLICLFGGLIDLFLGLVIYFLSSKEWGKGFLNSGGILLLLSGISCSTGFGVFN